VQSLLAVAPILLVLVLMIGLRWSAASAGILSLLFAVGIAVFGFGYGIKGSDGLALGIALGGVLAEALFLAGTIVWIIFPALCIYELQNRSGAFEVLRLGLERLSGDRRIAAILVAWFFTLFLEGAAGFGTPVALAAPILVSLGFAPVQAVTLALIGHAAGVSFGAVGTPIFPQMAITGFSAIELAHNTALMHALLGGMLLIFLYRIASRDVGPAKSGTYVHWAWIGLAAPCFLVPFLLIATFIGPELPTLVGALVGGSIFVVVLRWRQGAKAGAADKRGAHFGRALWQSSLPYVVLLVLILTTRLIGPLQQLLQGVVWQWSLFDTFSSSIQPLYHPGSMLLLGFVIGGLLQGRALGEIGTAAAQAAKRMLPVVVALVAMLGLSRVMVHAGMISALAEAAAGAFGPAWPLLVPTVGVLGSFVTGSATASNILLTSFQEATARVLGLPVLQMVAAQGFGAAVGNIICPHNIIAGAATVGLHGQEGQVLRRTALACFYYAAAGGMLLLVIVAWT
jgi:lactate permease